MTPIVAVVGGGQLARMMAAPATALGLTLRVLVESPEAASALPAHQTVVGLPTDPDAIQRLLAHPRPAALTWEHEHIPADVFDAAEECGVPARPGLHALLFAQDKIEMRTRMDALGLPNPAWTHVDTEGDVEDFLAVHGGAGVLKTSRGGYDGKGVRVIHAPHEAADWLRAAADGGPRVLLEEKVPFDRELAVLVARRPSGEMRAWPTVESIQRAGVCSEVIAPAPDLPGDVAAEAARIGEAVAEGLGVTGVLAVELFLAGDRILVNELAMRPHNSGHWTIDGAVTSQFEQHLRAVLDLPLGDTAPTAPWTVMANVLGGARATLTDALAEIGDPGAKVQLYGKGVRAGRKVGHVNVSAATRDEAYGRAVAAAAIVRDGGAA
ncbi:5-(carboxyamino)imidazole ribonucleotide synthase [Demequina lignilytica]|uniref:N5-carboxyaminoimidazole ribonucleotide synthase n=1 Tax=Demequina lignilytica TaxID=3051663 RepID=A0AAW7M4H5_9MICO|nr:MULTISPECIES: 5-(carboxyamino)imidazole ribonucleotide synthase [unclassified Demequina]MDN4478260.1 5-(carboxyamino)imidazole ribonucleotide synthase [Demequina sp. SYSU T00039-1]MDN4482664.1 5-(carboxyamino)imidazole ribonucleotide synthase [Demequina sp. SYSU T0a273]MDN4488290.1 5-(carboxyamino)imidazole ribonucleotide synthase [Demequina sp. SYSU T00039]MDN4490163.1 5-(carboxyamino)imidazole ribonucleotide synthase [Demequina sp. SYSU T00068]